MPCTVVTAAKLEMPSLGRQVAAHCGALRRVGAPNGRAPLRQAASGVLELRADTRRRRRALHFGRRLQEEMGGCGSGARAGDPQSAAGRAHGMGDRASVRKEAGESGEASDEGEEAGHGRARGVGHRGRTLVKMMSASAPASAAFNDGSSARVMSPCAAAV